MSQQAPAVIPVHLEGPVEVLHPPMLENPHPPDAGTPTPEEVRATEAVFAHDQQEHALVHGLLGMWAGTLLLHDLAKDHFDTPEEEDEPRKEDRSHP